jgi:hypothetical protein
VAGGDVSPYAGSATQLHLLLNLPPDANKVEPSEEKANAQDECKHKQHEDPRSLVRACRIEGHGGPTNCINDRPERKGYPQQDDDGKGRAKYVRQHRSTSPSGLHES